MNRTLLLIICDFLLLSLLGFVRFDMPEEEPVELVEEAEAGEEEDLSDTLREMLELEQDERERLNEEFSKTQETLQQREEELAEKEEDLNETQQNLNKTQEQLEAEARRAAELAAERERIANQARQLELEKAQTLSQAQELARRVQQTQAQLQTTTQERETLARAEAAARERARLVQEQLAQREQALAQAEQQMQQLSTERAQLERDKLNLASELKLTEAEKAAITANLESTQALVEKIETEKAEIRQQTTALAEGVSSLAESQTEIKTELSERIEDLRELTVNEVFRRYQKHSRVFRLTTSTNGRVERNDQVGVFVTDGAKCFAVLMPEDRNLLPGGRQVPESVSIQMIDRDGKAYNFGSMGYLQLDGRIVVAEVGLMQIQALGIEPFPIAVNPWQFPKTILIGEEQNRFGDLELQLDTQSQHHLRVDKEPFSQILGDFTPKKGDLVFTKTGAFLGILVNKKTSSLIDNFETVQMLPIGNNYNPQAMQSLMRDLDRRMERLPSEYR